MHIIFMNNKFANLKLIKNQSFNFSEKKFPKGKIWILYNV
jgi:hypothetical protein